MNGREIVKTIMSETKTTNAELASKLKVTQATLWDRLNTKKAKSDLGVTILCDMLRLMDYKVVVVPRTTRVPNGGYEIE